MLEAYKQEILTQTLEMRQREVTEYQVNIDNFILAIAQIGSDPDMQEFKQQLVDLLDSNQREQRKSQIMLDVIQAQLNG